MHCIPFTYHLDCELSQSSKVALNVHNLVLLSMIIDKIVVESWSKVAKCTCVLVFDFDGT